MSIRHVFFALAVLALVGGGIALAASSSGDRDPAREDCPGLIDCPLTGEKICADKCPLNEQPEAAPLPPCCREKQSR